MVTVARCFVFGTRFVCVARFMFGTRFDGRGVVNNTGVEIILELFWKCRYKV